LDRHLVETTAEELGTRPGLIEKDWHVVRALGILAVLDHGDVQPVFSGGTSLSIAWGLIKRFSEDIDFKVAMAAAATTSGARAQRRTYRKKVLEALGAADFDLVGTPLAGNASNFFSADFAYRSEFDAAPGLRPHLRIEMTFEAPSLPSVERPIRSLVAQALGQEPEVPAFPCVDPIETAADKLSALAWRVCTRDRSAHDDDPTIIRHLHDLAALGSRVAVAPAFAPLLLEAATADTGRGGGQAPTNPGERFSLMLKHLSTDPLWADEYDNFVLDVSFARPNEVISFTAALGTVRQLVKASMEHREKGA